MALHRHQRRGALSHTLRVPSARAEERDVLERARRLIQLVGMERYAESFASELSYGTLRLLELACMIALEPRLLLLDEPTSGISQKETEALGPLLLRIKEETGATFLIIEHDMPLVMGLSDWVYCLDAGRNLANGAPATIKRDPRVVEAYLGTRSERAKVATAIGQAADATPAPVPVRRGRRARSAAGKSAGAEREVLLELVGVDVFYDRVQVLYDVDLVVRRGERIALLGTNGAGKSTILRAASGLLRPAAGTIRWKGADTSRIPAEELVRRGLGHVPGGRGLFPTLSVVENLRMGGYLCANGAEVDAGVKRAISLFAWIGQRLDQPAGTLSGGEQQQLATARALMARPDLLMIDELSLGLAPLVIERLMQAVQRLHEEEGLTVVLVEQQATLALAYTDRAYFLEKGEVRYEGPSPGLAERPDLLRSVFLSGAAAGFGSRNRRAPSPVRTRR
ncbi:MAG: ATP-binding cassette domain-containing protein [Acidimicrobiales bacterium]